MGRSATGSISLRSLDESARALATVSRLVGARSVRGLSAGLSVGQRHRLVVAHHGRPVGRIRPTLDTLGAAAAPSASSFAERSGSGRTG